MEDRYVFVFQIGGHETFDILFIHRPCGHVVHAVHFFDKRPNALHGVLGLMHTISSLRRKVFLIIRSNVVFPHAGFFFHACQCRKVPIHFFCEPCFDVIVQIAEENIRQRILIEPMMFFQDLARAEAIIAETCIHPVQIKEHVSFKKFLEMFLKGGLAAELLGEGFIDFGDALLGVFWISAPVCRNSQKEQIEVGQRIRGEEFCRFQEKRGADAIPHGDAFLNGAKILLHLSVRDVVEEFRECKIFFTRQRLMEIPADVVIAIHADERDEIIHPLLRLMMCTVKCAQDKEQILSVVVRAGKRNLNGFRIRVSDALILHRFDFAVIADSPGKAAFGRCFPDRFHISDRFEKIIIHESVPPFLHPARGCAAGAVGCGRYWLPRKVRCVLAVWRIHHPRARRACG